MGDLYADAADRFRRDTSGHEMTVLVDDGLYRHVKFASQRGGLYRFDLITWPNNLVIRGDGPNFMFCVYPTADLFRLFKESSQNGGINPGYWQEKVVAGQVMSWSEQKFHTWLGAEATKHEGRHPGLLAAVGDHFVYGEHSTEYEATARHALTDFEHDGFRLRFPEKWEQDFDDYDWSFLWACHAIVWGIDQYDATKKTAAAGGKVAAS